MKEKSEYDIQAENFLEKTETKLTVTYLGCFPYFSDDEKPRDVYSVSLVNSKHAYIFKFGDSINNTNKRAGVPNYNPWNRPKTLHDKRVAEEKAARLARTKHKNLKPSAYDILACLSSYSPGSFEDFCGDYGYDTDSRKALDTYLKVQEEYNNLIRLFTQEEMELLGEIS